MPDTETAKRDHMSDLAMELLATQRQSNENIVNAIKQTAEFSTTAINGLRSSTATEAQLDRESNRKDSRQMMALIALFGALIAGLSGLNIMYDAQTGSVSIEGTPAVIMADVP